MNSINLKNYKPFYYFTEGKKFDKNTMVKINGITHYKI